jgi:hypothetical protein
MTKKTDSCYFQETYTRMVASGWKPHAIRLLFNNGIVDSVNKGDMTINEGRMHYPLIDSHPCLDKAK